MLALQGERPEPQPAAQWCLCICRQCAAALRGRGNSDDIEGIAGGELLVVSGTGLGPATETDAQLEPDNKLPTSLGGTTITFGGVVARLVSVQVQRIVCIAPFSITSNGAKMQVQSSETLSNSIVLPATTTENRSQVWSCADRSCVWYSQPASHSCTRFEPLAAVNQDGTVNAPGHPAARGSIVTVYVAGLRPDHSGEH